MLLAQLDPVEASSEASLSSLLTAGPLVSVVRRHGHRIMGGKLPECTVVVHQCQAVCGLCRSAIEPAQGMGSEFLSVSVDAVVLVDGAERSQHPTSET